MTQSRTDFGVARRAKQIDCSDNGLGSTQRFEDADRLGKIMVFKLTDKVPEILPIHPIP